jgi:hypothetical protein
MGARDDAGPEQLPDPVHLDPHGVDGFPELYRELPMAFDL